MLEDREARHVVVSSEPYLLVSNESRCVSGIEHVIGQPGELGGELKAPKGRDPLTVALIGSDNEPGMIDKNGNPKRDALPDFVILLTPESARIEPPNKLRDRVVFR